MYKMSLSRLGEPEVGGSIDGFLRSLTSPTVITSGSYPLGVTGVPSFTLGRLDTASDASGNVILSENSTVDYKIGPTAPGFSGSYVDYRQILPQEGGLAPVWSIINSSLGGTGLPVGTVNFFQPPLVNGQPLAGSAIAINNSDVSFSALANGALTAVQVINSPQPRSIWKVQMLFRGGTFSNPGTVATMQYFLGLPTDTIGPVVTQTLDTYQTDCTNGASNNMITSAYLTLVLPTPVSTITLWAAASAATNLAGSMLFLYLLP